MQIKKVEPIVLNALQENVNARYDDFVLIHEVLNHFVNEKMSLESVLIHHVELGLPSLETITRCRRKLQEKYPELRVDSKYRRLKEREIRQYARS